MDDEMDLFERNKMKVEKWLNSYREDVENSIRKIYYEADYDGYLFYGDDNCIQISDYYSSSGEWRGDGATENECREEVDSVFDRLEEYLEDFTNNAELVLFMDRATKQVDGIYARTLKVSDLEEFKEDSKNIYADPPIIVLDENC